MISFWGAALVAAVLMVVFVNGWTDAPNAIATAVATRAISYRAAVRMAAVANLSGLLVMSLISISVADTIMSMADFTGVPLAASEAALCASMAAIVLFAVSAWYFGIPTSESHALMAALAGASLALGKTGPDSAVWIKILIGLAMSLVLGFLLGRLLAKKLGKILLKLEPRVLDRLQVLSAGGMAFMHGAQDGQKFAAILIAATMMAKGSHPPSGIQPLEHIPAFIACAVCMALGTRAGGRRIVEAVGLKMVSIRKHQGVCSDIGSIICLFLASLTGIPMSTTHTKTSAILGAGVAEGASKANWTIVRGMLTAWIITFPVCGAIGYLLTKVFLRCQM